MDKVGPRRRPDRRWGLALALIVCAASFAGATAQEREAASPGALQGCDAERRQAARTWYSVGRTASDLPEWYLEQTAIERDPECALADLEVARTAAPDDPEIHVKIGDAHAALERWTHAAAAYDKALAFLGGRESAGDRAIVLERLAQVAAAQGDAVAAAARLEEAVDAAAQAGRPDLQARGLHSLGERALAAGDPSAAEQRLSEAVRLYRQVGEMGDRGRALWTLAELADRRGETESACEHMAQAGTTYVLGRFPQTKPGDPRRDPLRWLRDAGCPAAAAIAGVERALALAESARDPAYQALAHEHLGALLLPEGDLAAGCRHAATARSLYESLGEDERAIIVGAMASHFQCPDFQ